MTHHNGIKKNRSRAFTLLEVCVAAALIASLLVTTLKMLHALEDYRRTSQRRCLPQQALAAALEQIGNVPWSELTTETAKTAAIPASLRSYLPDAKLAVDVVEEINPSAKRITGRITWDR